MISTNGHRKTTEQDLLVHIRRHSVETASPGLPGLISPIVYLELERRAGVRGTSWFVGGFGRVFAGLATCRGLGDRIAGGMSQRGCCLRAQRVAVAGRMMVEES